MRNKKYSNTERLVDIYSSHLDVLTNELDEALKDTLFHHAIISSGAIKYRRMDDNPFPFKTNPYFCRWLPLLDHPNCYLIYTPGKKPVLIYFQEIDFWHKSAELPSSFWVNYFEIIIVNSIDEINSHLPNNKNECILITDEYLEDRHTFDIRNINPKNVINIINYGRSIKTEYEIECLRKASRIAVKGHHTASHKFKEGASEFDIHMSYCKASKHSENELPYKNIIAINENASILHYQHYQKQKIKNPRSFLIDAGAIYNGYASDISRTYAYDCNEFKSIIDGIDQMQQEIIDLIKIDMNYIELHIKAHEKIAEIILQIGLANGSIESIVKNKITDIFFPHGLGHFLGLQVHDVGGFLENSQGKEINRSDRYPFLRLNRKIKENQVFTIEPGLYVIDLLINKAKVNGTYKMLNLKQIEWLKPYGGIRIEDNIRVLDRGIENITRNAFNESPIN